jgi:beta-glucosidase
VTFYKSVEQLPDFENYSMAKRTYRYFDGEPLYPFGFGLSYTTFAYDKAHVDRAIISGKEPVAISVEVKNTGTMASDEVVQLYLTHPGVAGAPLRALKGFQRVSIAAGKTKTVTFVLRERELSVVDEAGKHRLIPGKVTAWIGGGQPIAAAGAAKLGGAATEFTITGEATLPD